MRFLFSFYICNMFINSFYNINIQIAGLTLIRCHILTKFEYFFFSRLFIGSGGGLFVCIFMYLYKAKKKQK